MKLNDAFIAHAAGSESVLVPTGAAAFSGVARGNQTFGEVLELLANETTESEIVLSLRSRYNAPAGIIERDVAKALEELRKIGALDE